MKRIIAKSTTVEAYSPETIMTIARGYNKAKAAAEKAKIQMSVPMEYQQKFIEALEQLAEQREAVGAVPYFKDGKKLGYTIRLSKEQSRSLFISSKLLDDPVTKQSLIDAIKGIK